MDEHNKQEEKPGMTRRDVVRGLATVPVLGAVAYGLYKKKSLDHYLKRSIADE